MIKRKTKKITMHSLKKWRRFKYENTLLLVFSLILVFYLAQTPLLDTVIAAAGELSYLGAFIVGIFFVSTFTVAPAVVVLYHLADTTLHPVEVALLAGLGAMVGDYFIFRFVKDRVFDELKPLFLKFKHRNFDLLYESPFFAWLFPVFGAILIASPLPDEAGVSMLGMTKLKKWQFLMLAFVLNSIGILATVLIARLI